MEMVEGAVAELGEELRQEARKMQMGRNVRGKQLTGIHGSGVRLCTN